MLNTSPTDDPRVFRSRRKRDRTPSGVFLAGMGRKGKSNRLGKRVSFLLHFTGEIGARENEEKQPWNRDPRRESLGDKRKKKEKEHYHRSIACSSVTGKKREKKLEIDLAGRWKETRLASLHLRET